MRNFMAGLMLQQHQRLGLPTIELSWKEFFRDPSKWWDNRSSKQSPRHPDFQHRLTKQPLWMDHRHNPSWVTEELINRGLFPCIGAAPTILSAPSPSFIWACCKNKDLGKGTMIHDELRRRGLDEKPYSDALVTLYAKCGEVQKAQALLDMHHSSSTIPWNALIAGYARKGKGQNALDCFQQMQHKGLSPSAVTYTCVLKSCSLIGAIDLGKQIHDEVSRQGLLEHDVVLGGALVDMYAKCGALQRAQTVLEKLPSRDVISWNALIAGYAQNRQGQLALDSFEQMQREGLPPSTVTYVCILQACAMIGAIDKGKQIHDEISRQGLLEHEVVLGGALVDMYAKCGALHHAQGVLEKLPSRNVVSWNALIAGYVQSGQGQHALHSFEQMQREGLPPSAVTYVCILQACAMIGDIDKGNQIHDDISRQGLLEHEIELGRALVDMYAKCGALLRARNVLEKLPSRDIVAWDALIAGYAQNCQGQNILDCFEEMQHEGILPSKVTYVFILQACAMTGAMDKGKKIHDEISSQGMLEHDVVLGSALVGMYAKFGALGQAQSVLEKLPSRNVVSWNALIGGYVKMGQGQQALNCFGQMQHEGIIPDEVTFVCIIQACAMTGAIGKGKEIHDEISRHGLLEQEIVLGGALVDMYAKCGALRHARSVLETLPSRNVVSWNALIGGCLQNGQGQCAFDCLGQMQCEGILPDQVTYLWILQACAVTKMVNKGKQLHDEISRRGLLEHNVVLGSALVDMYAKCGALHHAQRVLEKLPSRDAVSYNALIAGYSQNGQGQEALDCFERMEREGILPNEVTYGCILQACAVIGAVDKGKQIHDEISTQRLLEHDIVLGGALVDMYAKCGALPQAHTVLEKLPSRDIVSWNALIAGYAKTGQGEEAFDCLGQMQHEGIPPDEVTFTCLLNLCSHLGLVEKGQELYDSMNNVYGLKPNGKSFNCMVDLLGRAGHLVKAVEVIQGMPTFTSSATWHCLLGACTKWVDVDVGMWAFEQAADLDKCDGAAYALMASVYEAAGLLEKAKDIEAARVFLLDIQSKGNYL